MGWLSNNQSKSMLGQLLVKQKLITEEQLANAIELQRTTGQRLGDIFAELNLITHQHIEEALRKQRRLRMAAAIATSLLAPMETYAAQALPSLAVGTPVVLSKDQRGLQIKERPGLQALSEEELGDTSAQGLSDELLQIVKQTKNNGLEVVGDMAKLLNPVLGFLEADTSMKNVVYDPSKATATINKDGSLTLNLPSSIGELNFNNIRVKGTEGASFGSISIKGIDLTGTSITMAFHH
ncbi:MULTISPECIES: hypothetical protein [unclassified Duganella]|uniref:hypothetical protein n=1 Tax=unclassified Duganella TaxID=2636909 RepID=UPI000E35109F|nr:MULTISPECIES: hypothetical protein [unclassified Duganella]RFP08659.1 hypothetical protein D0T23_28505 [Duganella sp. BJB475]RFP27487.1 hypothetical protein D0T21_22250 [Duganella sp. BJB476]